MRNLRLTRVIAFSGGLAHGLAHGAGVRSLECAVHFVDGIVGNIAVARSGWELRVYIGRDERGRERQTSRSFSGTKREAQSALAAFVTETEHRRQIVSSKMCFADHATQWLASRESAGDLEAKTFDRYHGLFRDHLIP